MNEFANAKEKLEYTYTLNIDTFDATVRYMMRPECILRYQQQAGEDQLEMYHQGYNDLVNMGLAFVVTNTSVKINRMPVYNDKIRLVTWNRGIKGAKFFRGYNWYDENNELLIESGTAFVLVDTVNHKLRRADAIDNVIPFDYDKVNAVKNPKKVFLPDETTMKYVGEKQVVFSQLDGNGHLNNSFYTDFVTDYTSEIDKKTIKCFSIDFISEARLNDKVKVYSVEENGVYYFYGEHERGRCFRAKCEYK